jgi:hypothetical protein
MDCHNRRRERRSEVSRNLREFQILSASLENDDVPALIGGRLMAFAGQFYALKQWP